MSDENVNVEEQTEQQAGKQAEQQTAVLEIPEAYQGKGWVAKIRGADGKINTEAVFKQLDNLDGLVGKKQTFDYANASPEERTEFLSQLRPAEHTAYKVEGVADAENIQKLLHKHSLPKDVAENLVKDYLTYEQTMVANLTSEAGYKEEMKKSFGDGFEKKAGELTNIIKSNLSEEDRVLMDEKVPNSVLGIMYRFASKIVSQYGVTETDKATGTSGSFNTIADAEAKADDLFNQLQALRKDPTATAERKSELIKQYQSAVLKARGAK